MATHDPTAICGVTDAQVAAYRRDGWVHLPGFLSPAETHALLALAQARMGADGCRNTPSTTPQEFFNPEFGAGLGDRLLRPVIDRVAADARHLIARRVDVGRPLFR